MTFVFIINPQAGRGSSAQRICQLAQEAFSDALDLCELYLTQAPGDAVDFVKRRCQAAQPGQELCFLACGGDGTLNEVVRGVLDYPFAWAGVIPCGTGNDFVKNFADRDFADLAAQRQGSRIALDLLHCNGRPVVNICNAGLDANVARDISTFKRLPFCGGAMAYLVSLCKNFFSPMGWQGEVSSHGQLLASGELLLLVLANGRYYGGSFLGAPEAALDDGLLDLSIVPKLSRPQILSVLPRYQKGLHTTDPQLTQIVTYCKQDSVSVRFRQPVTLCIDGETLVDDHLEAIVLPGALRLWLPAPIGSQAVATTSADSHVTA